MDPEAAQKESNVSSNIKRKPEEEVQFVSSKPVKKLRSSREIPAEIHRAVDPVDLARVVPPRRDTRVDNFHPHLVPGLPTCQPLHESSNFNRGVSLPSMENYVFPPPPDQITSQISRSSPMLSPKQLPRAAPSYQADSQLAASTTSGANDAKLPAWFDPSWAAPGMPPQPMLASLSMAPKQPMVTPYVQPSASKPSSAIRGERQQAEMRQKLTDSAQSSQPVTQPHKELSREQIQNGHQLPSEENTESMQATQPLRTEKTWQPALPSPRAPPNTMPQTQAQRNGANPGGYAAPNVHPLPSKPPCLACEQMRQQALHNKTSIYPLVAPASHAHHGWHSPELAHLAHPTHMQPAPFPAANFGVNSDVSQNHMHRPQQLYHGQVPMGYGLTHISAQAPYPIPVQRAFPLTDMSASESGPGMPSHKFNHTPQPNMSPSSTTVSEKGSAPYFQGQPASSQPLAAQPSSTATSSPTPAAAPVPHQPTPSPPEKHSPNLIVDIAETCEELFPWGEVAERHNVPRQKVVDTFAAIIQLPLIRCTTDKKRHGRLATNRLKDYTRGKNAMNIASPASPATPPATSKSDSNEAQDDRPVLPGVVELANTMAPVGFPSTLTKKYPGAW